MNRFVTLATLAATVVCLTACATNTHHTRDWEQHGVKIVHGSDLELNTAQTPGMTRAALSIMRLPGRANYGQEGSNCTRTQRQVLITTASLRALSMS